mmetsp:Transcript_83039/g.267597  ORF Transcript_83039/g.267597 Transcript_83039/m.267597 type:complete len:257 (-) Transcript_83039:71-841(-)
MLGVGLGLEELSQLTLGLLLQILQDVEDASGVRLVGRGRRSAGFGVVVGALLLSLEQRLQFVLVRAREGGRIQNHGERLQHFVRLRGVNLRQGGRVLRHLLLEDADGATQGVDGIHQLLLARREVRGLLLADQLRVRQLLLARGDGARQLPDLRVRDRDVAGELTDLGLQLGLLLGRVLDRELGIRRRIVAPLDVLGVSLGLVLAIRGDLRRELVDQVDDLAERIRLRLPGDGSLRGGPQEEGEDGSARCLHCCKS